MLSPRRTRNSTPRAFAAAGNGFLIIVDTAHRLAVDFHDDVAATNARLVGGAAGSTAVTTTPSVLSRPRFSAICGVSLCTVRPSSPFSGAEATTSSSLNSPTATLRHDLFFVAQHFHAYFFIHRRARHDDRQIARVFNFFAVEFDDDVADFDAGFFRRPVFETLATKAP